jgi:hypothetical protein
MISLLLSNKRNGEKNGEKKPLQKTEMVKGHWRWRAEAPGRVSMRMKMMYAARCFLCLMEGFVLLRQKMTRRLTNDDVGEPH